MLNKYIYSDFFENGFETLSPSLPILNVEERSKVTLTYDKSITNLVLDCYLYYLQGNTYVEKPNTYIISKKNGQFEVNFVTNQVGNYKLIIFGGLLDVNLVKFVEFQINCTKAPETPLFYPTIFSLDIDSEFEIIEPLYTPLIEGNSYIFKVHSTLSSLYVLHFGEYIAMNKDANGVFTSDKIDMSSYYAAIATKDHGRYEILAEYPKI